ncbi:MAG: DNA repair protein RecO [Gammaproteobacteria bacterium]|jgi:DNA repair protein RecO (recombination protein O)
MSDQHRIYLQPSYVIHQRPYRDTSALLEIFSEHHGRCALVARGVKRPNSKLRGLLQPFQPLLLSWVSRSDLGTLTNAELYEHPRQLNTRFLPSAFYLNELIHYFLHRNDAHEALFNRYHTTLRQLQSLAGREHDDLMLQVILRRFELELLKAVGYALVLDLDVKSQSSIESGSFYEYQVGYGPVRIVDQSGEEHGVRISGATLLGLADDRQLLAKIQQPDDDLRRILKEAKRLLRCVIDYHLGHKTLHSRELVAGALRPSTASVR